MTCWNISIANLFSGILGRPVRLLTLKQPQGRPCQQECWGKNPTTAWKGSFERARTRRRYLVHALQNSQDVFDCRVVRVELNGLEEVVAQLKAKQLCRQAGLPHVHVSLHDGGVQRVPPTHCDSGKHNRLSKAGSGENHSLQFT